MKKLVLGIALVAMVLVALPVHAQHNPESDFQVTRTADLRGVIITGFTGTGTVVNIPPQIRGLPVVEIGREAFGISFVDEARGRRGNLTNITIPDTVTVIGARAFNRNQLTSVTIGSGVTRIGIYAFSQNQLVSVVIPNSVTYIERSAFSRNQLTSVTIGSGVTRIGISAFSQNQLVSVTFPSGVIYIGMDAFSRNQLTNVTFPNGVIEIGVSAFQQNQLASVTIPSSVRRIGYWAFYLNPLINITIGSNVELGWCCCRTTGRTSFTINFHAVYNQSNRRAGTYVRRGNTWVEEW